MIEYEKLLQQYSIGFIIFVLFIIFTEDFILSSNFSSVIKLFGIIYIISIIGKIGLYLINKVSK